MHTVLENVDKAEEKGGVWSEDIFCSHLETPESSMEIKVLEQSTVERLYYPYVTHRFTYVMHTLPIHSHTLKMFEHAQ